MNQSGVNKQARKESRRKQGSNGESERSTKQKEASNCRTGGKNKRNHDGQGEDDERTAKHSKDTRSAKRIGSAVRMSGQEL